MRLISMIFLMLLSSGIIKAKSKPISGLNWEDFAKNQNKSEKEIDWQNNPFSQPAHTVDIFSLKLFGIIYNSAKSYALINREIVSVGERVGAATVVSINPKEVILRNENGIFHLNFEGRKREEKASTSE